MSSHRRTLLQRALATAAAVAIGVTAVMVAPASADHPGHGQEECRGYPSYPGSPNPWIKVVAEDNRFDTDCLQGPANRKFRIYLENRDADPHNISIYSADPAEDKNAEQLYRGRAIKGPGQEEYAIDALPPGDYFFQDDKTPGMAGRLTIPQPRK